MFECAVYITQSSISNLFFPLSSRLCLVCSLDLNWIDIISCMYAHFRFFTFCCWRYLRDTVENNVVEDFAIILYMHLFIFFIETEKREARKKVV